MRKWFYRWMWNKLYLRAVELENKYYRANNFTKVNDCIKMQNMMNYLKEALITGEVK